MSPLQLSRPEIVKVFDEPIAKAGYEVVTEATEPADVPATNVDPDIVGAADETIDSAAPASRGRRGR